jgi:hypothetical protein
MELNVIMRRFTSGFFRKNDGSAIIEFALVAPLFFLLVFAMLEFGLFLYSKIIVENIAVEISRTASIGKPSDSQCPDAVDRPAYIKCIVKHRSSVLINGDKTQVQIIKLADGETLVPDICFDVNPPSSEPATCSVYQEVNENSGYQGAQASNLGVGRQLIEARISYPWSVLMPLMGQFFKKTDNKGNTRNVVMITASTVIRNEPF